MKHISLIVLLALILYSCKKEEKSVTPTSTVSTPSPLIGKYAYSGSDGLIKDTIYIYESSSYYYMTCPDKNNSSNLDTINITIDGNNVNIPTQPIYGGTGGLEITGTAIKVGATQLTVNWNTQTYSKTNIYYYKQ